MSATASGARPESNSELYASPDTVHITSYQEALEVFRSPASAVILDQRSRPFRDGTMLRIDGAAHAQRRRMYNRLTRREGHAWFREHALKPILAQCMTDILEQPDSDGIARVDLVIFVKRVFVQVAAAMIGLNPLEEPARLADLLSLWDALFGGWRVTWSLEGDEQIHHDVERAIAAMHEFDDRFFTPALADHERLIQRVSAGELAEADLPHDLLSLVVLGVDPSVSSDHELALREALVDILGAGTATTMATTTSAVDDLDQWLSGHPEDRALPTDPRFLLGAIHETLRLFDAAPGFFRRATQDLTLSGGTRVRAGQNILVATAIASRDPSVFGADAHTYNPRRVVPHGVYPYGLAFGSGPHMCFGLPIALGAEGIDGSIVHVMRTLHEAGMRRDPDRAPRRRDRSNNTPFVSYPVVFARARPVP